MLFEADISAIARLSCKQIWHTERLIYFAKRLEEFVQLAVVGQRVDPDLEVRRCRVHVGLRGHLQLVQVHGHEEGLVLRLLRGVAPGLVPVPSPALIGRLGPAAAPPAAAAAGAATSAPARPRPASVVIACRLIIIDSVEREVQRLSSNFLAVEVRTDPTCVGLVWKADVRLGRRRLVPGHHVDGEHGHLPAHGAPEEIADVGFRPALRKSLDHKCAALRFPGCFVEACLAQRRRAKGDLKDSTVESLTRLLCQLCIHESCNDLHPALTDFRSHSKLSESLKLSCNLTSESFFPIAAPLSWVTGH